MIHQNQTQNQARKPTDVRDSDKVTDIPEDIFSFLFANYPPDDVDIPLSLVSPNDSIWDQHRTATQRVSEIYNNHPEFQKWGERTANCSPWLLFKDVERKFKLSEAFFCHVRMCPTCQWRKSLYEKARAYRAMDIILNNPEYENLSFIFLTLTVENCPVSELRLTLSRMNKSWKRLIEREIYEKTFKGFVKMTEITRDKKRPNTHAHPHFHVLLVANKSYFTDPKKYLNSNRWAELWGDCLRVGYVPVVDVRGIRPKRKKGVKLTDLTPQERKDGIRSAVAELIKYSVKPADMLGDGSQASHEWFLELSRQIKGLKFVSSGGILKDLLRDRVLLDDDMVHVGESDASDDAVSASDSDDKRRISFRYRPTKEGYYYDPRYNEGDT